MANELRELVEGVKPVIEGYVPDNVQQERWRGKWLAKAYKALADVELPPESQLLTEVWAQYRYATQAGYAAEGIETLEEVQAYLTAKGVLDGRGNIIGID